jgi:opacity protein-like surface antigen
MRRVTCALAFCLLLVTPGAPCAEPYLGLYAGVAFPGSSDLKAAIPGTKVTARDVERDTAAVVGGKVGYWLDVFPYVGAELDASHHGPDADDQAVRFAVDGQSAGTGRIGRIDLNVTSVGFNVLGRWPGHRIEPYLGVGPAMFITRLKDTGKGGASIVMPSGQDDTDTTVGVQAIAGLKFFATKQIALFAEYKFSHHKAEFRLTDELVGATQVKSTLSTSQLNLGFTYHFR